MNFYHQNSRHYMFYIVVIYRKNYNFTSDKWHVNAVYQYR